MYLFGVLACLLIDKTTFSHAYVNEKCCKSGDYLKLTNNTSYQCTENLTKRLGVITNATNFLDRQLDGECVDISSDFSIFEVSGGKVVGENPVNETYFPKCCPLSYSYNSVLHACEEKENMTHEFIREMFVKVGLPGCKMIVDYQISAAVDLYDSIIDVRRDFEYCIDENERGAYTIRECQDDIEVCDHIKCVKKCCPDGQSFVNGANCVDTYTHGLNLSFSHLVENPSDPFAVISNRTCKRIYLMNEKRFIFRLDKNGIFVYWFNSTNSYIHEDVGFKNSYCIEHSKRNKVEGFFFFKCFAEIQYQPKFKYTLVPKVMSCIFLAITILIYIVLNEIRNIFGKILINYCVASFLLFSLLVYAHIDLAPTDSYCEITGFALVFFSTVSFAWLNIMCCDIWWTFGHYQVKRFTKQSVGAHQRKKDLRRLLMYLLYGWGMPTILTLNIYLFNKIELLPYSIKPYVGGTACFIENRKGNYAAILFLRLPHLIIQLVNTVLFFRTIIYCLRIKNEINKINDTTKHEKRNSFKKDKERLSLIVKLSVIMGVTYIFDVMSSFFDMGKMGAVPQYIEIIWDCVNCLQGVFIFIIFICKKKIYYDFLKKMKIGRGKKAFSNTQSTITSTTRMSVLHTNGKNNRIT